MAADDTAFVMGYTGATGRALIDHLICDNHYKKVLLIGRRKIDLPKAADDRFVQEVVNFDEIENYKHLFTDCKVGFCCIGTLTGKGGTAGLMKVDRDYVINTAAVAREAGCNQFHLLSSTGANKNSMIAYGKAKGEAEEGVTNLNFPKLVIYRPGLLIADRDEFRCPEATTRCLCFCCFKCCPSKLGITVEDLARAMLIRSKNPIKEDWVILDNPAIDAIVRGN